MVTIREVFSSKREGDGHSHIPELPFWVATIRVGQLIFAILVIGLTAFAASVFGSDFFSGYPMSWFTFIWTGFFFLYIFVTPAFAPQAYLYWAHLGLEILTVIFWLTTFALLAQESQAWDAAQTLLDDLDNYANYDGYGIYGWSKAESAIKASKAATAFAAFNWALFVVTLSVFGYYLHKHRVRNGGTGLGGIPAQSQGDVETAQATQAPLQQHVVQQTPHQQQVYQQVPVEQQATPYPST